jgi:hypothetical protein
MEPSAPCSFSGPLIPRTCPRTWLALESVLLYVVVPVVLWAIRDRIGVVLVPIILVSGFACYAVLGADPAYDRRELTRATGLRQRLRPLAFRLGLATILAVAGILLFRPEQLFDFPRQRTALWALVMVGYPLVSVFPQELIFRAFLAHRYRGLFGRGPRLLLANAVSFGLAHLLFGNWFAPALCTVGGVVLARSYLSSHPRTLLLPCLEHALYGQMLFTVGYGQLLYAGATP